jgi:hypothetical protein
LLGRSLLAQQAVVPVIEFFSSLSESQTVHLVVALVRSTP